MNRGCISLRKILINDVVKGPRHFLICIHGKTTSIYRRTSAFDCYAFIRASQAMMYLRSRGKGKANVMTRNTKAVSLCPFWECIVFLYQRSVEELEG